MRILYAAGLLLFVAAIAVFCIQNFSSADVKYLGWSIMVPLPVLVLSVYVLGMLSGWGLVGVLRKSIRIATGSEFVPGQKP